MEYGVRREYYRAYYGVLQEYYGVLREYYRVWKLVERKESETENSENNLGPGMYGP